MYFIKQLTQHIKFITYFTALENNLTIHAFF